MKLFRWVVFISLPLNLLGPITLPQNFFPLKTGNIYQIEGYKWSWGLGSSDDDSSFYYHYKVSADTIIGGEKYYGLTGMPINIIAAGSFLHFDSLINKLFIKLSDNDTIRLAADFNLTSGASFISYITGVPEVFISKGCSSQVILGDTHTVYTMQCEKNGSPLRRFTYDFCDDLGLSKYSSWWTYGFHGNMGEYRHSILSAIIDSIVFNILYTGIDSIYPVTDKPINKFPFQLSVPITSNAIAFIDSFQLFIQHTRMDTIVNYFRWVIPKLNPVISFNLSGLEVGDIIKLRAQISDTTIYFNSDNNPDTGWTSFRILDPLTEANEESIIYRFYLLQNYPNPFNPVTTIICSIPEYSDMIIKVFDILGNEIETLVDERKAPGRYEIIWNAENLPGGIYFYRLLAGSFMETRKMVLLK